MAESRRAAMYDKKKPAMAEKKADDQKKPDDAAPAKKPDEEAAAEPVLMDKLAEIRKRHEGERKDFHGNMRDQLRSMSGRHDKELADLMDQMGQIKISGEPAPAGAGGADESAEA